jgi:hypothetical protein
MTFGEGTMEDDGQREEILKLIESLSNENMTKLKKFLLGLIYED